MDKIKKTVIAVVGFVLLTLGLSSTTAQAWPSGIMYAGTSRAASYKFLYGDDNDTIQTHVKCSNTTGGIRYTNGPRVGRGVWSNAYCPQGYYVATRAAILGG